MDRHRQSVIAKVTTAPVAPATMVPEVLHTVDPAAQLTMDRVDLAMMGQGGRCTMGQEDQPTMVQVAHNIMDRAGQLITVRADQRIMGRGEHAMRAQAAPATRVPEAPERIVLKFVLRTDGVETKSVDRANACSKRDFLTRCLAKTCNGLMWQAFAFKGRRRCRMRRGTNPRAPKRKRNPRKHGGYFAELKTAARIVRGVVRLVPIASQVPSSGSRRDLDAVRPEA